MATLVSEVGDVESSSELAWKLNLVNTIDRGDLCEILSREDNINNANTKLVHFIRHAQGHHNVAGEANYTNYESEEYEDAHLSAGGIEQCCKAAEEYGDVLSGVPLVVVSIMNRCMQTAQRCFPGLVNKEGVKWMANEDCREQTGKHPCDRRVNTAKYREAFPHIDFSDITAEEDPLYWKYGNEVREPDDACFDRCKVFLEWVSKRPEKEIIVCTHSAILGVLIPRLCPKNSFRGFRNCELRSYILSSNDM